MEQEYEKPSLASDIALFTVSGTGQNRRTADIQLHLLLVRRANPPYQGMWALPGGFVNAGESVLEAALRELEEETGVSNESLYVRQLHTYSQPGRDPRGWIVSCAHIALSGNPNMTIRSGDDASDTRWFSFSYTKSGQDGALSLSYGIERLEAHLRYTEGEEPEIVSSVGLAFDHAVIIAMAMDALRKEVGASAVALKLLPQAFTLNEMKSLYENINGEKLQAAAFRRKAAPLIEETGRFTDPTGRYPVMLYKAKGLSDEEA